MKKLAEPGTAMVLVLEEPIFSGFQWKLKKLAEPGTAIVLVLEGPIFSGFQWKMKKLATLVGRFH